MKNSRKLSFILMWTVVISVRAEVVTDGTLGSVQNLSDQMIIPQSLGATVGNNLFHSFQTFNINTGESATFTGSDTLHNVISRVTGGLVSTIDGLLKSEIPHANFYFINPAGVTFGANAQVDVPAAFHVSTANSLHFSNGDSFSSSLSTPSQLSVSEPISFGFLGNQTGNIEILGSQLNLKASRAVSFSSGNLTIHQSKLLNKPYEEYVEEKFCNPFFCGVNSYSITDAKGNDLRLYAVGNSQAEIRFNQKLLQPLSGQLNINHSVLDTSGIGAGYLQLNAGQINVTDNSQLFAHNLGGFNADSSKGINIVANDLKVTDSEITANTLSGDGGYLNLNLKNLTLSGRDARIGAMNINSLGKAGDVNIQAQDIKILNGSRITTEMRATDLNALWANNNVGNGGNIHIKTQSLTLDGQQSTDRYSAITSIVWPVQFFDAMGHGGNIAIEADTVNLLNLADISTTTLSAGIIGGNIGITASHLTIDGQLAGIHAGTVKNGDNSGSINITANTLEILHGGAIVADSASEQHSAGNITITADSIKINGLGNSNAVPTGIFTNTVGVFNDDAVLKTELLQTGLETTFSLLLPENFGGDAGHININTKTLDMQNAGMISSALLSGDGNPGNITIHATEQMQLASGSQISNRTEAPLGVQINFEYDDNIGEFFGSSISAGAGFHYQLPGKIELNSPVIKLDNSHVNSNTTNFINAGDISLLTDNLALFNGSAISSSSSVGYGDAGKVSIHASSSILLQQSSVNTLSTGYGRGGDIEISTVNLSLDNHASIAATSKSSAPSGNISLIAPVIAVLNNSSIAAANTGSGTAGTVEISQNNTLMLDNHSAISTDFSAIDNQTIPRVYIHPDTGLAWTRAELFAVFGNGVEAKMMIPDFYLIGDAGSVLINTQTLSLTHGSRINSQTDAQGSAGNISVVASNVLLNNAEISAAATHNSSGQTGDVKVSATQSLQLTGNAKITIQNDATVVNPADIKAGLITVSAPDIALKDSAITAQSNGNVNAGNIDIRFSNTLYLDPSYITTSANLGNGGSIFINSDNGLINLQNSGFFTSVTGATGNGGNINVSANTLIMDNGAVQANAVTGSGGDINLNLKALIPTQNQLIKGGLQVHWQPFISGFNVIQAASASGVNGTINISSPQFNISGSISGLDSAALVLPIIGHSSCQSFSNTGSSLVSTGKGGIPDDGLKFSFVPAMQMQNVLQQAQYILTTYGINERQKSQPCRAL